jgi:uncharacterized membrane protein YeaQ/YmgE (transglycosylase-associated protein family)
MTIDTLIIWIIVGAIMGVLMDSFVGGMRIGLAGAMMIGIMGAIIGGWVFEQFNVQTAPGIWGLIIESILGSLVMLLIFSLIRRS